jgi:hypothetical protein
MHRRLGMRWLFGVVAVVAVSCGSSEPSTTTSEQPHPAEEAVRSWLDHLAADDDAAAFADLAPRSRSAVGDLGNYRRGSSRFGPVYDRYANGTVSEALRIDGSLVVVTLRIDDGEGAVSAVPVRRIDAVWKVDPILDVGSYSVRPDDGEEVDERPTVTVQLDDPAATAEAWFDGEPAEPAEAGGTSFRPDASLSPGIHVVTLALRRGDDIVARAFRLRVT